MNIVVIVLTRVTMGIVDTRVTMGIVDTRVTKVPVLTKIPVPIRDKVVRTIKPGFLTGLRRGTNHNGYGSRSRVPSSRIDSPLGIVDIGPASPVGLECLLGSPEPVGEKRFCPKFGFPHQW
jgi:hypothetical protein